MTKRAISIALALILMGTTLLSYDSVFSDYSYAESESMSQSQTVTVPGINEMAEITDAGIDVDIKNEPDEPINLESKSSSIRIQEGETITTPAPIRSTALITNPYKGYSYTRLINEINKLQAQYPEIIQTEYIGKTVSGKQIPLVKLGTGEKKILIMGSEHAREYVTTSLIMRSIDTYSQAWALGKSIDGTNVQNVLSKVTFYFVPMVNIDGVQIVLGTTTAAEKNRVKKYVGKRHYNLNKNRWKANLRGVDLNRNYPFRWKKTNTVRKRAYMSYRGKKQASEPEVKAIVNLCANNKFAFMFTMHTRGQIIYWKDKYNGTVPGASTLSNKVRSITGYRKMPTSGWGSCAGESAKWFRSVYNKPAFTIELTPSSLAYKKACKNFDKYVWKRNKSLFLRTALTVTPTDTYKVYLSAGKGKVKKRYVNVKTGQAYGTLPKAKRKGYRFKGWYTAKSGGTKITSSTIVTQVTNKTLYAKWKKK